MSLLNLFPSAKQLLSLDIEFGVPMRWVRMLDVPIKQVVMAEDEEDTYYNTTAEHFIKKK